MFVTVFGVLLCIHSSLSFAVEPNPPTWPSSVKVFGPGQDSTVQQTIDNIFKTQGGHSPPFNGQWSNDRYAFLFQPGSYNVDVNIGFYTTLMGMGKMPSQTIIENVICENGDFDYTGGALDNFWRSAENFMSTPTLKWNNENTPSMMWAVSQASPLRRVQINGDINIWEYNSGCCAGYASGGYLSDSIITGQISSGSQQQWITRNSNQGSWLGGVWNMVQVGCKGSPSGHCGDTGGNPETIIDSTPIIAEKPYIYYNSGKYYLQIPNPEMNKIGASSYGTNEISIDFTNVYVTSPTDTADTINNKLSSGIQYVVITPGIYNLTSPITINKSNTVILGLGMATLISGNGNAIIQISSNVDGVRIAGLLLQAGSIKSETLLSVGSMSTGNYKYNSSNPTILYDIFARVGGTNDPSQFQVSTTSMIDIYNDYVIIDNSWLWRADHDITGSVSNSDNPVLSGLRVYGNNVITYGLAVEHTLGDLVLWNGNNGKTYFFQSEFPYDVTQSNYGDKGYVAFRVNGSSFEGYGIGAYCYFRDHAVTVQNGMVTSNDAKMVDPLTVFLNGNGQITHVWNNQGDAVAAVGKQAYVC